MTLDECQCDKSYCITKIHINDTLAQERLNSLGLVIGTPITPLCTSAKGATISIQANQTLIALRSEEAKQIEVTPLPQP